MLEKPFTIKGFLSPDEIDELIDVYDKAEKIYKSNISSTGITTDVTEYCKKSPIMNRLKEHIGDFKIEFANHFNATLPHVIHTDGKQGIEMYKGITLPLKVERFNEDKKEYPYLCFFDQYYLQGPAKFFNGSNGIPSYYNMQVYEYHNVKNLGQNDANSAYTKNMHTKYFSHMPKNWLAGLTLCSIHDWIPGDAIIFDCIRLHAASNFKMNGIRSKLGLSIFTTL
mgnify:CR=1 FL=1